MSPAAVICTAASSGSMKACQAQTVCPMAVRSGSPDSAVFGAQQLVGLWPSRPGLLQRAAYVARTLWPGQQPPPGDESADDAAAPCQRQTSQADGATPSRTVPPERAPVGAARRRLHVPPRRPKSEHVQRRTGVVRPRESEGLTPARAPCPASPGCDALQAAGWSGAVRGAPCAARTESDLTCPSELESRPDPS